jgi:hypothetical protein
MVPADPELRRKQKPMRPIVQAVPRRTWPEPLCNLYGATLRFQQGIIIPKFNIAHKTLAITNVSICALDLSNFIEVGTHLLTIQSAPKRYRIWALSHPVGIRQCPNSGGLARTLTWRPDMWIRLLLPLCTFCIPTFLFLFPFNKMCLYLDIKNVVT